MMKRMFFTACILLFLCLTANLRAQDTAFWFVAPQMTDGSSHNYPAFLAVSNGTAKTAHVTITLYNDAVYTADILPNGLYKLDFPTLADMGKIQNPRSLAGSVTAYGIHITSDVKVSAYYMFNALHSKDIFTLKGRQALGTLFYVPMQSDNAALSNGTYQGLDQIDIVATEDDTEVRVLPKARIRLATEAQPLSDAGTEIIRWLDKGETLKILEYGYDENPSLAGTKITATRPVAVTVTEDMVAGDTSGDQIVPVSSLGTRYIVPVTYNSTLPERFYLVATEVNTTVDVYTTVGSNTPDHTIPLPVAGATAVFNSFPQNVHAVYVKADKPVYVYQRGGFAEEGAALLPSVYAIGQTRMSFFQIYMTPQYPVMQKGFLVFRTGRQEDFSISYGSGAQAPLTLTPLDIPYEPDWKIARFDYNTPPAAGQVVTIQSMQSAFSLGYITGYDIANDSYGYFSAFGEFEFAGGDTTWMCGQSVTLQGGYAMSYEWKLNGVALGYPPTTSFITVSEEGAYTLVMNQDPNLVTATTVVQRVNAGAVSPALHRHCTPVTLQVTGATEPAGTQYQWQSNATDPADEAAWADIQNATTASYTPPSSSQTVWYRRGMSSDVCAMAYTGSAQVNPCTVPVNPHLRTRVTH